MEVESLGYWFCERTAPLDPKCLEDRSGFGILMFQNCHELGYV